jgi:hypothetical protein
MEGSAGDGGSDDELQIVAEKGQVLAFWSAELQFDFVNTI